MFYSKSTSGFYDLTIHGQNMPADVVEISADVHAALMDAQSQGKLISADGNGFPIAIDPPMPTIDQAKSLANSAIDDQAGETRKKYITDVAGQSETYLLKANDAQAYKTAGYPSAQIGLYPMVQAEAIALYGATPTAAQFQSAADYIIGTQLSWLTLAAKIEQQRRAGKIAVGAATTNAGVASAEQAALAALAAL